MDNVLLKVALGWTLVIFKSNPVVLTVCADRTKKFSAGVPVCVDELVKITFGADEKDE